MVDFYVPGITLLIAGTMGISAYGPMVKQGGCVAPKLVLVVTYVLFSAVVAFVGYNAAASHGCFALGRGGGKITRWKPEARALYPTP